MLLLYIYDYVPKKTECVLGLEYRDHTYDMYSDMPHLIHEYDTDVYDDCLDMSVDWRKVIK